MSLLTADDFHSLNALIGESIQTELDNGIKHAAISVTFENATGQQYVASGLIESVDGQTPLKLMSIETDNPQLYEARETGVRNHLKKLSDEALTQLNFPSKSESVADLIENNV